MEFYERTRVEQLPTGLPFPWLPPDVPVVHVAEGSQERSVVTRVLRLLSDGDARHVLLSGAGRAGGRAVSCSDAVLRRAPGAPLRRAASAGTRVTAETWEPRARGCGLDTLVVRRSAHTLTVLLTKTRLNFIPCTHQGPCQPTPLANSPTHPVYLCPLRRSTRE
uniref:DNA/RNA-binding protein Alba-like domain-containing protein n=1 Tax=Petromyzon marinus TaxID=7757 RepID=S4RLX2_PETMA